jgi:hypothetical protein
VELVVRFLLLCRWDCCSGCFGWIVGFAVGVLRFSGVIFAASTGAGLVLSPSLWLWLLLLMVGVGSRFDLAGGCRFDLAFASAWPGRGGALRLWSWSLGVVAWRWWCGFAVNNQQLPVVWSW